MLKFNNVTCGYDDFKIKDITFSVPEGGFCAIIGPNGAGKTTIFRAINGQLPLLKGSVIFQNKKIETLSYKTKAQKIAIVSQRATFDPQMAVEDYVALGRLPYHSFFQFFETQKDKEIIQNVLELTRISCFKNRTMAHLSGGERQLVFLARALAQEPDFILLDEPTNHLDITHQLQILDLVKQLNQDKKLTVLIILHDLNLASEYSDHLLLMENGKIFDQGGPGAVLTYQNIEKVFSTLVLVHKNPLSQKPFVFLVSRQKGAKN